VATGACGTGDGLAREGGAACCLDIMPFIPGAGGNGLAVPPGNCFFTGPAPNDKLRLKPESLDFNGEEGAEFGWEGDFPTEVLPSPFTSY